MKPCISFDGENFTEALVLKPGGFIPLIGEECH